MNYVNILFWKYLNVFYHVVLVLKQHLQKNKICFSSFFLLLLFLKYILKHNYKKYVTLMTSYRFVILTQQMPLSANIPV